MKKRLKIISWNVNGIRAVVRKGFLDWLDQEQPDILGVQETKAHPDQLDEALKSHGQYYSFWSSSEVRKGYSGVAIFTKEKPITTSTGFGIEKFDQEGRVVMAEYEHFVLFNVYFPNGKKNMDRLQYKLEFYEFFLKHIEQWRHKGKQIIFCGDVNTAHRPIDLARPQANENVSGFLPIEREWIDRLLEHGYLDTLREFNPNPELYTWWDLKTRARERNVGWRIDYFFIQSQLKKFLKNAYIMPDVMGSDHCPVAIEMEF